MNLSDFSDFRTFGQEFINTDQLINLSGAGQQMLPGFFTTVADVLKI